MSETYFDAVIDHRWDPVFNGTPEETVEWLKERPQLCRLDVIVGRDLRVVGVPEYLAMAAL